MWTQVLEHPLYRLRRTACVLDSAKARLTFCIRLCRRCDVTVARIYGNLPKISRSEIRLTFFVAHMGEGQGQILTCDHGSLSTHLTIPPSRRLARSSSQYDHVYLL